MCTKEVFFALLVAAAVLTGCDSDGAAGITGPYPYSEQTVSQTAALSIIIETQDANSEGEVVFSAAEQIQFVVFVTNLTGESKVWKASDTGYPAFCVRKPGGGSCEWDSRHGYVFATVIVEEQVPAMGTVRKSYRYGQTTNAGGALPTGEYEVKAWLGADENERLGSRWLSFAIR